MEWSWHDIMALFHHVPHAVDDLRKHEDAALVRAGLRDMQLLAKPETRHTLILPQDAPQLSVQKDINPAMSRSEANLGLLLRDYLNTLPGYHAPTDASQALLEHWRHILTEQPRRLAEVHAELSSGDRARHFWQDRLRHMTTAVPGVDSPNPVDDWERAAGAPLPLPRFLKEVKTKQWQDLVIRKRLHDLDRKNMGHEQDSMGRFL
ncbi:MAG: hypothetical protein EBV03_08055 [Proteobacteria bacterium]|nr:hypothetical protein [Pseudomonadota bacterium]